jgi:hypothetical protein
MFRMDVLPPSSGPKLMSIYNLFSEAVSSLDE